MQDQVVTFRWNPCQYAKLSYYAVSMAEPRRPGTLIRDILESWLPDERCPLIIDPAVVAEILRAESFKRGRPLRQISMTELLQMGGLP